MADQGAPEVYTHSRLTATEQVGGKPVICLFPPTSLKPATVSLELSPEWNSGCSTPSSTSRRARRGTTLVEWNVVAEADGSLFERSSGLELKYLFWEATSTGVVSSQVSPRQSASHPSSPSLDRTNGVVVPFTALLTHLDTALARLSLHTAARNDFLTYWMAHFTHFGEALYAG